MPYRLRGKTVQVQRKKKWVKLKTHRTVQAAMKHLIALRSNVKH